MRKKKMRVAMVAFAAFAVSGMFAGSAQAQVVFDDAEADIGPLLVGTDPLCDDPDRAGAACDKTAQVTVAPTGGPDGEGVTPVMATAASFQFPVWLTQLGTSDLDVDIFPTEDLVGTLDGAGANIGSVAFQPADFTATVSPPAFPGGLTCTSANNQWAFTTENGPPGQVPEPSEMLGDDFTLSPAPIDGAVVALWDSLQPFVSSIGAPGQSTCNQIALGTAGPGGLWLAEGLTTAARVPTPDPVAETPPATTPAKKKCKKGQKLKKNKCVKKKKKKKKK